MGKAGLKPQDEQDRAKQVDDLLAVLERFGDNVILAGDFNAHIDALPFFVPHGCDSKPDLECLAIPRLLQGGFHCAVRDATGEPMNFSQWGRRGDVEIKSVIDHVMLRGSALSAIGALNAVEDAAVIESGCLPNIDFPSDHIPVVVDVEYSIFAADYSSPKTPLADKQTHSSEVLANLSLDDLLEIGRSLPQDGRVKLTDDGFKYVSLPKEWQLFRGKLAEAASSWYQNSEPLGLAADKAALQRRLPELADGLEYEWGFWDPPSCVGLHISLGKHASSMNVDKRVRFQIKKVLHFTTRKLGAPSRSEGIATYCSRWITFEVRLIDEVRCDGEEPHISFAVFGARTPAEASTPANEAA